MDFTISETIITKVSLSEIEKTLINNFSEISRSVELNDSKLEINGIHDTFGSINRKDTTFVHITKLDKGFLVKCSVKYRPSVAFWIILILTLFTYIGWIVPIIMYLYHKTLVQNSVANVLKNSKNELELMVKNRKHGTKKWRCEYCNKTFDINLEGALKHEKECKKKESYYTEKKYFNI